MQYIVLLKYPNFFHFVSLKAGIGIETFLEVGFLKFNFSCSGIGFNS